MPAEFEPILKVPMKQEDPKEPGTLSVYGSPFVREGFWVNEKDTTTIITNVFISVALMILAALIMALFYWSYTRDPALFMVFFSLIGFIFGVYITIFIAVTRSKFGAIAFKMTIGSAAFFAFLSLMVLIYFSILAGNRSRAASFSSYSSYSAPRATPAVQDYLGNTSSRDMI